MRIPFTIVSVCENIQLALIVSPRIATATLYGDIYDAVEPVATYVRM